MLKPFCAAVVAVVLLAVPAIASPVETRLRLRDGKLATTDLSRALLENFHLHGVEFDAGQIDLTGVRGWTFVRALNASLGEGCTVRVEDDALVLSVDPA